MNCKQGDLAIITRSQTSPEAVGLIVRVIEFAAAGSRIEAPDGLRFRAGGFDSWLVEYSGSPRPARSSRTLSQFGVWADRCLRPIRPGDMEDETPTAKELEAV